MEIEVFVSSLGAYNEGCLTGQWTELPVDDVQKEILDKIDGQIGDEFFISDYEAPFKIDEYEDLWELNNLAEALQPFDSIEDVYFALDDKECLLMGEIHSFDEYFFEVYFNTPMEAARAIYFGNIKNWTDEYIRFDIYSGGLESMSRYEFEEELDSCSDEIIQQFAAENKI